MWLITPFYLVPALLLCLWLLPATNLLAREARDCDGILVPTVETSRVDRDISLSYIKLIDQKTFEKHKRDLAIGAPIPIPGVAELIQVSANYNQFDQNRASYLQRESFRYNEVESRSYLKTHLPNEVVAAWVKCKTADIGGVALVAENRTDTSFTLRVDWVPFQGMSNATADIFVQDGDLEGATRKQEQFSSRLSKTYIGRKEPIQNTTIRINVGGDTDSLVVFANQVVRPAIVAPCVRGNASGECVRCEWGQEFSGLQRGDFRTYICPNMHANAEVKAGVIGKVGVDGGGDAPWIRLHISCVEATIDKPNDRTNELPASFNFESQYGRVPGSKRVSCNLINAMADTRTRKQLPISTVGPLNFYIEATQ